MKTDYIQMNLLLTPELKMQLEELSKLKGIDLDTIARVLAFCGFKHALNEQLIKAQTEIKSKTNDGWKPINWKKEIARMEVA